MPPTLLTWVSLPKTTAIRKGKNMDRWIDKLANGERERERCLCSYVVKGVVEEANFVVFDRR